MCLILDANRYSDYVNPDNADMKPVRRWVENGGGIAYSPTEKMEQEMDNSPKMQDFLRDYSREGKVKIIDKDAVDAVQKIFSELASNDSDQKKFSNLDQKIFSKLASNDSHIIALAIVGEVKLLVSNDKKLGKDFKERLGGSIYKKKSHARLLNKHTCKS